MLLEIAVAQVFCIMFLVHHVHNGFTDFRNEILALIEKDNSDLDDYTKSRVTFLTGCLILILAIPLVLLYILGEIYDFIVR